MSRLKEMLKKTVRVSEYSDPALFAIFRSVMEDSGLLVEPLLRKGNIGFRQAAIAMSYDKRSLIILSDSILSDLEDPYFRFVIGHEIGHIIEFNRVKNTQIPSDGNCESHWFSQLPDSLFFKYINMIGEQKANVFGISACGGIENAITFFGTDYPTLDVEKILLPDHDDASNFPPQPLSGFDALTEFEMLLLRDMMEHESEEDDEAQSGKAEESDAEIHPKDGLDEGTWFYRVHHSFPVFTQEDNDNLKSFAEAAIYICTSGLDLRKSRQNYMYNLDGISDFYFKMSDLWKFPSVKEALKVVDSTKDQVKEIMHPIKYETFRMIAEISSDMEWDENASDSLIFEFGADMGFSFEERLECIERFT